MTRFTLTFLLLIALCGCRDRKPINSVTSMKVPDSFFEVGKMKTIEDFQRALATIEIQPVHAHLSADELSKLNVILLQMEEVARANNLGPVCISSSCDVFDALDSSLVEVPGWDVIHWRAQREDRKVEIFSISAFIKTTQAKK